MSDDDAGGTGYKRPPKDTRFKSGKSGNPNGRPRNKTVKVPRASMADAILSEEIDVDGKKMTKGEAFLRTLLANAFKGNSTAIRAVEKMMTQLAKDQKVQRGGVLVVPGMMDLEAWAAMADITQAPFRDANYGQILDETSKEKD